MSIRTQRWLPGLLLCVLAAVGCDARLQAPEPPELDDLVEAYKKPKGELVGPELVEMISRALEQLLYVGRIDGLGIVKDLVRDIEKNDHRLLGPYSGIAREEPSGRPDALLELHRVCGGESGALDEPGGDLEGTGWAAADAGAVIPDPDKNGRLELFATATFDALNPVIWGQAENCRESFDGQSYRLDGDIAVFVRESAAGLEIVVRFEGTLEAGELKYTGLLDFRSASDDSIEVRIPLTTGDVIIGAENDGAILVVKGRSGTWRCDVDEIQCVDERGRTLLPE